MPRWITLLLLACAGTAALGGDEARQMAGEWKTSMGSLILDADGDNLAGGLVAFNLVVKGQAADGKVKLGYDTKDKVHVEATLTLDPSGRSFSGPAQSSRGNRWVWQGWHVDPTATQGQPGDFAGTWLTDLGLMELTRDGSKFRGRYAFRGRTSSIEGEGRGRHFEGKVQAGPSTAPAFFDLDPAGSAIYGAGGIDGQVAWYGWNGRKAPQYVKHAALVAGSIVDGATEDLLTYTVRAPEGYKAGDVKTWPAVLILHGSNMNASAYVNTIAGVWPDIARDYILLGINGETPSQLDPADPRFNYTYVNYVGPGKGFAMSDRESPGLVRDAMAELKQVYPIQRYFVGGHSQGAFLTYSLMMFSPDLVAGAFPISGGLLVQAEPTFFQDEAVKAAQRAIPLAIVHGLNDPNVGYPMGTHALGAFLDAGWPAVRMFTDERAGHMFGLLPVGAAIRWLEKMTCNDPAALAQFAEDHFDREKVPRDAVAALQRARALKPDAPTREKLDRLDQAINALVAPRAAQFVERMKAANGSEWVDDFHAFRDGYQYAAAAAPAIAAFDELRRAQNAPAKRLADEALGLFRQGKQAEGLARAQAVVDRYPASESYRLVKGWLAERQ